MTHALKGMVLSGFLALLPTMAGAAEEPRESPPPVKRVVVYPDRALVTRAVDVACGTGLAAASFRGLPLELDPSTLRAAVQGAADQVEAVSLNARVLAEAQTELMRTLEAQIEALQVKVREQQRAQERAGAMRAQGESMRAAEAPFLVRESAAEKKPNTAAWAGGLDAARELIDEANARALAADVAMRELGRQVQELSQRLNALSSSAPRRVQDADVLLRCAKAGAAHVELSYMIGGVSWEPLYEARANPERTAIDLSVLATITQATGEPWKGVEVTLSTATTRRDATPPQLQRLNLGAYAVEDVKKVLVRRDVDVSHVSAIDGRFASLRSGGEAPMAAEDQGLSVQLKVPGVVDFAGDGRPARVLVETIKLPAKFELVTIPKLLPHTFRAAEAQNLARYPLVPGRVELFSGGSFIGSSRLPLVARGDKLKLAFGIDEQVKVHRTVVEELKRDPGFLGSTRKLRYAYKVEVSSYAGKPTEVSLQEQVPVSQMADVKVLLDPTTTAGYELAKDDGILTWKLKLAPKEKRKVELRFAVEVPTKYDSSGL